MAGRTGTPVTRCHQLAGVVSEILLTLLRERAVDGFVSLAEVERVAELLRRGTITLDEALRVHESGCRKEHARPKGDIGARSNPFQRLMVRPFEHLLTGENPIFPRACLTNYFMFVDHAIGARLHAFEERCRAIVQALLVIHGNNLTWEQFYSDPRTVQTLQGALTLVTREFGQPNGQALWHACMVRPVGEVQAPPASCIAEVYKSLVQTHRGLATAS